SGAGDTTGTVLDVGDPGMPSDDCVAVTQTAETEMRPVDLIMVGDPETDQVLLRNAVTNLLPQLGKARGPDTRVVLIAGEAPPMGADPRWEGEFDCGEWDCRGASQFGYFRHIEVDLDPDAVLTEVMGLAPEWEQHMRTDTWKHIWISSSRGGDPSMSAEAFTTAFNAMGESYEQFTLHSLVTGPDPSGNFGELAVTSGGVFYHESLGGSVYSDFVEGVLEKLQGTPLSCEYSIPEPPAGQTFDPMRVNVEYEDDGELFALGYVEDAAACEDAGAGWYYDDPAAPTTIHVCPFTCGVFNTIESGSIEIVFGCATVPAG
ncbi:MAG: hypothetical protein K0V04_16430, partial [Deltaproteobacteria bacterium]|nr:hypothetical protein [Deltaproteobacteria bacterium]